MSAAAAPGRAQVERLHLRGSSTYACRRCGEGVRVVSAYYLPDDCPACGAATWTAGRCSCSAARRPGIRGQAFCHACGEGIWTRMGGDAP